MDGWMMVQHKQEIQQLPSGIVDCRCDTLSLVWAALVGHVRRRDPVFLHDLSSRMNQSIVERATESDSREDPRQEGRENARKTRFIRQHIMVSPIMAQLEEGIKRIWGTMDGSARHARRPGRGRSRLEGKDIGKNPTRR
jgi:hypothetical protein